MRSLSSALVVAVFTLACQAAALGADAERGRALYENHCVVCHTSKVHPREPRMAVDGAQLYKIVNGWQAEQGLRWSREEIDDVVDYLARTYYKY
ncbi:MAG: c-type cytochrome [Betaproteobacteria bacterium]